MFVRCYLVSSCIRLTGFGLRLEGGAGTAGGWRARCLKLVKKAIYSDVQPLLHFGFLPTTSNPCPESLWQCLQAAVHDRHLFFFRWLAVASFKVMSVSSSIGACAPCPRFRVGGSMRDTVRPCASAHMEQRRPELYSSAHPPQIFHCRLHRAGPARRKGKAGPSHRRSYASGGASHVTRGSAQDTCLHGERSGDARTGGYLSQRCRGIACENLKQPGHRIAQARSRPLGGRRRHCLRRAFNRVARAWDALVECCWRQ